MINEALAVFDILRTQSTSMYLHDLRILNVKKFDRHVIKKDDFVILLDRAQQNHEFCYGVITQVVTPGLFKDHHYFHSEIIFN